MANFQTVEKFFEDCSETYCTVKVFLSRFTENPVHNLSCGNCDFTSDSCPAKEYLTGENDKMLFQYKMMEKFKYAEEKREKKDLGWNEIGMRWFRDGHAEKFRNLYSIRGDTFEFDDIFLSN